ncbi:MAG TPA: glycosyltransferase family 4 protein [Candidatus Angelobacter sp.]|nr:glycosyltransferase family 4 protein [Candidatus Angelobacter sp.]
MRIAFLTRYDPRLRTAWSGTAFFMFRAVEQHCGEVTALGPAAEGLWLASKVVRRLVRLFLHKNIDTSHSVALSRILGRTFRRKLSQHKNFDLIFAPAASTEIAFLDTDLPIVLYGDLTAKLFQNYAANLTGLSPWAVAQLELIERRALHRASHVVYASEWAAQAAVRDCNISQEKVSVIPMGANLDEVPTAEQVNIARKCSPRDKCRLIFIGVDWERKGGDTALAAMRHLRERGVNASLTVAGCVPPRAASEPNMRVIPFLDKSRSQDQQQLIQLLLESDFMLFPTRREAFGIVCCEANACGIPLIVSDVGGVPVKNGENGILLPAGASGRDYADAVQDLLNDPERYLQLAHGGRHAFDSRLNWGAWGRSMNAVFRQVLAERAKMAQFSREHACQECSPTG